MYIILIDDDFGWFSNDDTGVGSSCPMQERWCGEECLQGF